MFTRVITISPQGQITIPKNIRKNFMGKKFLLEFHEGMLFLKPCRVMIQRNYLQNDAFISNLLDLSADQKKLYNFIRLEPCSTDVLSEKTGFEIQKINVLLTELEFKDLIRKGGNFLFEAKPIE